MPFEVSVITKNRTRWCCDEPRWSALTSSGDVKCEAGVCAAGHRVVPVRLHGAAAPRQLQRRAAPQEPPAARGALPAGPGARQRRAAVPGAGGPAGPLPAPGLLALPPAGRRRRPQPPCE